MSAATVRVERHGRVGVATLDRPGKHNALTRDTLVELDEAVRLFEGDGEVGCIVLAGEGPSFCGGYDLGASSAQKESDLWTHWLELKENREILGRIWHASKPTVCEVKGYCLGAGLALMSQCDLVVASGDATFGEPELQFSLLPQPHLLYLLPFRIAMEVMLLGRRFSANDAYRYGLINRVAPAGELRTATLHMAAALAELPAEIVQMTKRVVRSTLDSMGHGVMTEWGWDAFLLSKIMPTAARTRFEGVVAEKGMRVALRELRTERDGC
ncbi:MAG TPA: enoyl-CoA hydratase/isomerase family protein [Acidimicrobiales bacterium]|nr:enoyl-CoA hydratase/isomerase family protein [Acidimicrobiales bacterium]